jgi:hypothetical protein
MDLLLIQTKMTSQSASTLICKDFGWVSTWKSLLLAIKNMTGAHHWYTSKLILLRTRPLMWYSDVVLSQHVGSAEECGVEARVIHGGRFSFAFPSTISKKKIKACQLQQHAAEKAGY